MGRGETSRTSEPREGSASGVLLVKLVLLLILVGQCLFTLRAKSATYDEPAYIASGYLYLTRGAFEVDREHPPLMKYLFAFPLLFMNPLPPESVPNWNDGAVNQFLYGASFLFENRIDADVLLFAARCPVVAVSVLCGLVVWTWARRLYGVEAAIVALSLYCFCPNIIAHSSLATLDLGVSAGVCGTMYLLWRLYRQPSLPLCIATGCTLAAALLVKSSAMLILGLLPILLPAAVYWHQHPADMSGPSIRPPSGLRLVGLTAGVLVVALTIVSLAYGFGRFGLAEYASSFNLVVFRRDILTHAAYPKFCWGQYSPNGFRWYFLVAFVLKTPIPTLLLTAATVLWLALRRPRRMFDELFLVVPILGYFVATMPMRDSIGLRYILPIYPLLFIVIGGMSAAVWRWAARGSDSTRWKGALARTGAVVLSAWYLGGALWIAPDYLAYFNELIGGPANGIRYLDDSNVDWGQDLKQLARYLRENEVPRVRLVYVAGYLKDVAARHYGISTETMMSDEIEHPKAGWYAISAHILQRPSLTSDPAAKDVRFDWLDRFTPVARIGYSIYLYRFD